MNKEDLKAMLKAGSQELAKCNYDAAKNSFNDILDNYPKCSQAYIGLLMAELKINSYSSLEKTTIRIADLKNFKRAIEFGDAGFKQKLLDIQKKNDENRNLKNALAETENSQNKKDPIPVKGVDESKKVEKLNSESQKEVNSEKSDTDINSAKGNGHVSDSSEKPSLKTNNTDEPLKENNIVLNEAAEKTPVNNNSLKNSEINAKYSSDSVANDTPKVQASKSEPKSNNAVKYLLILIVLVVVIVVSIVFSISKAPEHDTQKTENKTIEKKAVEEKSDVDFSKPMNFKVGKIEFQMMPCQAGSFMMGSPENEIGRNSNEKQHKVTITKPYFIGKYEVTQELYETVTDENPSKYQNNNLPVESLSFAEALAFCDKLNNMTVAGRPVHYKFALPTEAQWEYACRAGSDTSINNGKDITAADKECANLDEVAWYYCNAFGSTHPVGEKKANAWNIHDMLGNVSEFCADSFKEEYETYNSSDPSFYKKNIDYVVEKGGNVFCKPKNCRSASRSQRSVETGDIRCGMRIVLVYAPDNK